VSVVGESGAPAAAGAFRASILLLCYRMGATVREALESAVAQTVPCEILVSDDASPAPDDGFAVAEAFARDYRGPHRLIVRRNVQNLGLCAHINAVAAEARGEILVFQAGDDRSHPDRVERALAFFDAHPDVALVGTTVDEIDADGVVIARRARDPGFRRADQRWLLERGSFVCLLGASMAMRRALLDALPPLAGMVEDNMITLRAALFGDVMCLDAPWLDYRLHAGNLHGWVFAHGGGADAKRQRYERTLRMYAEIAEDQARCAEVANVPEARRALGRQLAAMYRIESAARQAMLVGRKRDWWPHIVAGLRHPGLRRKSIERLLKLAVPRRFLGL
jgi:cellulose synthase/poly-beta-1,6-N-acetylglucosamine synthase-like glycosyltransferase